MSEPEWTWRDVAQWTDTEGTLHCRMRTVTIKGHTFTAPDCALDIIQKIEEKSVLESLCDFINQELGPSSCRLYERKVGGYKGRPGYTVVARVNRAEALRTMIPKIKPHIRTQTKRSQILKAENILKI